MTAPTRVDASMVRDLLGPAYEAYPPGARDRHAAMLERVHRPGDLEVHVAPRGAGAWEVTVATVDTPGVLSLLAGLLTAAGVDIEEADIFTLELPAPRAELGPRSLESAVARRRAQEAAAARVRLLDVFRVRAREGASVDWAEYESTLREVVSRLPEGDAAGAREQVVERVAAFARAAQGPREPLLGVAVDVDADADEDATLVAIRAADTPGFLFELTNGLAMLGASVQRAEVRSTGGRSHDRFWVTDEARRKIRDARRLEELRQAAVLIKQFTHLLPHAPNPAQALRQFSALVRQLVAEPDWAEDISRLDSAPVLETLTDLMGASEFLWDDFLRMQHESLFPLVADAPRLDADRDAEELARDLDGVLAIAGGYEERVAALNEWKDREMFRVDLRHLTRRIDLEQFSAELTAVAEAAVRGAAALALEATPAAAESRAAWSVLALGKFGGRELGYASDIELLFAYDDRAAGPGVAPAFEEWVREFRRVLRSRREGIFEIDQRLRPHGEGGPLASGLTGLERYYGPGGDARQFERMALVKLRAVAGDAALGAEVIRLRDAYVYSGAPLDLDEIAHLRHRQAAELAAPGSVNAKYSPGGLVDVEYFAQARQIEAGAREPAVRTTNTLEALERLAAGGHLDRPVAERAAEAYRFLRRLIDALRVVRGNAKDLAIPERGTRAFAYLARRLPPGDAETPEALAEQIEAHMAAARGLWDR